MDILHALEIGLGVYLGITLSVASIAMFIWVGEYASNNRRYGRPWWRSWNVYGSSQRR